MSTRQMELLLSRLSKVKKTGQDKWQALCPAHDDEHPSLSIAIGKSGAPVLKCWAGCGAANVLEAINLNFADLYPRRAAPQGERGAKQYFFPGEVFDDIKSQLQLAFLYLKAGNREGVLRVIERLQAINAYYHFETRQTPGKAQEGWGDDHE